MRNRSFFNKFAAHRFEMKVEGDSPLLMMRSGLQSVGSAALARPHFFEDAPHRQERELALVPADMRLPGEFYLKAKRLFDIVISLAALAVFGLFLPLIALLIKVDSPGPVFYSQERVGINRRRGHRRSSERRGEDRRRVLRPGQPFKVHKLRSMRTDAEVMGAQWATQNDSRVTRVGRFIRKTRIDELPQFLNVLRGEMSLIGPRPERLVFVHQLEKDIPDFRDRLLVKPGITGLAQVMNGYDSSIDSVRRKVQLDKKYINNACWLQDLKILASTVSVVLKGEGAL